MKKFLFALLSSVIIISMLGACTNSNSSEAPKQVDKKSPDKAEKTQMYVMDWKDTWKGLSSEIKHVTVVKNGKVKGKDIDVVGLKLDLVNKTEKDFTIGLGKAKLIVDGKVYKLSKENSRNMGEKFPKKNKKNVLLVYQLPKKEAPKKYNKITLKWDVKKAGVTDKKVYKPTLELTKTAE